ncbi:hypothetical protein L7F22_069073 [Adiantum nelumboides]|nr:hypothetical protein [Adiantum nelumboides]
MRAGPGGWLGHARLHDCLLELLGLAQTSQLLPTGVDELGKKAAVEDVGLESVLLAVFALCLVMLLSLVPVVCACMSAGNARPASGELKEQTPLQRREVVVLAMVVVLAFVAHDAARCRCRWLDAPRWPRPSCSLLGDPVRLGLDGRGREQQRTRACQPWAQYVRLTKMRSSSQYKKPILRLRLLSPAPPETSLPPLSPPVSHQSTAMSSENPTIVGSSPSTNGVNGHTTNGVATDKPVRNAPSAHQASFKSEPSNLGTFGVKSGLAQMLKGGVIMDVVNAEQARIAEEAGACAVMALERCRQTFVSRAV